MWKPLALATLASGLVASVPLGVPAQVTPPNVVLIVMDDMRADQLDTMPTVQSQVVAKGMAFTKAFTTGPICCPSRGSFLRGQLVHTHTMYETVVTSDPSSPFFNYSGGTHWKRVGGGNSTIAKWLDDLGYFTAEVGKYVNGYPGTAAPDGWDFWRQKLGNYHNFKVTVNGKNYTYGNTAPVLPANAGVPATCSQNPCYEADVVTDHAIAGVRASGTSPLFMWVGYFAPHTPWIPPLRYDTNGEAPGCANEDHRSDPSFNEAATDLADRAQDKPRWVRKAPYTAAQIQDAGVTRMVRGCQTMLAVDDGIARLLAALEEKDPGLQNTIIIFTSDQGVQSGNHMHMAKKVPWEETIRLPFVVRADGLLEETPSVDATNMILNIDVAPTLLQLAGGDPATLAPGCVDSNDYFEQTCLDRGGVFDGFSFAPLLDPSLGSYAPRDAFLIEHWDPVSRTSKGLEIPTFCAVRTADAKLIRYYKGDAWGFDWEGYDLVADPHELHSLVYSGKDGIPRFRGRGQEIYDELLPKLIELCDPRPPEYPPF